MKPCIFSGLGASIIGLVGLFVHTGAQAVTAAVSIAYTTSVLSESGVYVVDFKTRGRVHVGSYLGGADGTFTDDGVQRVVTLDPPLSFVLPGFDCNGNDFAQRVDTNQVVFRRITGTDRRGISAVVEIGTFTDIGGCTPGLVTPFGALTDPGGLGENQGMNSRPPITDLVPGAQLAGPSLDDFDPVNGTNQMTAQTVTFGAGTLSFPSLGTPIPYSVSDRWFAYTASGGVDRRYTRLSQNLSTGVEVWLGSDFVGGVTGKTYKFLMTKPTAGATFGSVKQSAHEWEVGLFIGAPGTIFYDFYRDFTGLRVFHNADGSTTTQPLTWGQSGNNLVNTRVTGQVKRIRTWTPIGTYGNKHFAFEDEYWLFPDGHTQPFIPPRVNFYVDNGVAVPPAGRPVQGQACRPCGKAARSTSLGFGPAIR